MTFNFQRTGVPILDSVNHVNVGIVPQFAVIRATEDRIVVVAGNYFMIE